VWEVGAGIIGEVRRRTRRRTSSSSSSSGGGGGGGGSSSHILTEGAVGVLYMYGGNKKVHH